MAANAFTIKKEIADKNGEIRLFWRCNLFSKTPGEILSAITAMQAQILAPKFTHTLAAYTRKLVFFIQMGETNSLVVK